MVGRILTHLKRRGMLKEPPRNGISTRKRLWRRHYAIRKPKGYAVKRPGDLVQVDTLDVRPIPGMVLKHFTARDMVSRWDVVEVRTSATANTATDFLSTLQARMPFPYRPSRWTEAPNSRRVSNRLARSGTFAYSCCHHALPSSMAAWSGPNAPTPKSSMRSTTSPWR